MAKEGNTGLRQKVHSRVGRGGPGSEVRAPTVEGCTWGLRDGRWQRVGRVGGGGAHR